MKAATLEKKTHVAKAKHPTELIRQIQKGLRFSEFETLQNSIDLPFEQLVSMLQVERSMSYAPLFQVLFGYRERPPLPAGFRVVDIEPTGSSMERSTEVTAARWKIVTVPGPTALAATDSSRRSPTTA